MDRITRRSIDPFTLLRWLSNDGQGADVGVLEQSWDTVTVVPATGTAMALKWQKLEGPAMILVFLGILLDTQKMEMRLPEEKLRELKLLIEKWLSRKSGKNTQASLIEQQTFSCGKNIFPRAMYS